jgi:23S rRNA (guanine745-N1)-methyltransferase
MPLRLDHAELEWLVGMGPSARHIDAATRRARVRALPSPTTATASVTLSVYRPC